MSDTRQFGEVRHLGINTNTRARYLGGGTGPGRPMQYEDADLRQILCAKMLVADSEVNQSRMQTREAAMLCHPARGAAPGDALMLMPGDDGRLEFVGLVSELEPDVMSSQRNVARYVIVPDVSADRNVAL